MNWLEDVCEDGFSFLEDRVPFLCELFGMLMMVVIGILVFPIGFIARGCGYRRDRD